MNDYDIGDQVRLTATFTNASQAVADPTTVTCLVKLRTPTAATTTYTYPATITKDSTGVYHVDITIAGEGIYDYRWAGTGTVIAAGEGALHVLISRLVP